jgi:hypothetical protein
MNQTGIHQLNLMGTAATAALNCLANVIIINGLLVSRRHQTTNMCIQNACNASWDSVMEEY